MGNELRLQSEHGDAVLWPIGCVFFLKTLVLWNVGLPQTTLLLLYCHKLCKDCH